MQWIHFLGHRGSGSKTVNAVVVDSILTREDEVFSIPRYDNEEHYEIEFTRNENWTNWRMSYIMFLLPKPNDIACVAELYASLRFLIIAVKKLIPRGEKQEPKKKKFNFKISRIQFT